MTFAQFFENAWRRPLNNNFLASIGSFYVAYQFLKICWFAAAFILKLMVLPPRKVTVIIEADELADTLHGLPKFDTKKLIGEQKTVFLWDPSTLDYFGETPAMNAAEVKVSKQESWEIIQPTHLTYFTISPGHSRSCSSCTAFMEKLNFC